MNLNRAIFCTSVFTVILFALSQSGNRLSPDSVSYLAAAQSLADGNGFEREFSYWPPMYPTILALHDILAIDVGKFMKSMNLFAFATMIMTLSILTARYVRTCPVAIVGIAVAALSQPIDLVFSFSWSEVLYLPLSFGALATWLVFLSDRTRLGFFLASGALLSLSLLTRHVAISLALTMALSLALTQSIPWKKKLKYCGAIAAFCIPYFAWLFRTWLVSGTLTGPRTYSGITPAQEITVISDTLAHWLIPHFYFDGTGIYVVLLFAVLAYGLYWFTGFEPVQEDTRAREPVLSAVSALLSLFGVYIIIYLVTLCAMGHAVSYYAFHADSTRYLSPIFLPAVLSIVVFLDSIWRHLKSREFLSTASLITLSTLWFFVWLAAPNRLNSYLLAFFI